LITSVLGTGLRASTSDGATIVRVHDLLGHHSAAEDQLLCAFQDRGIGWRAGLPFRAGLMRFRLLESIDQLLVDLAPHVEDFVGELFGIQIELKALAEAHHALAPIYSCKRLFVQRKAAKARRRATSTQEDRDLRGRLAAERNKAH
jgi:hypothetical protein